MSPLNLDELFSLTGKEPYAFDGTLEVEIGFGRGVFLRDYAQKYPDRFLIGVDIRKNIVESLSEKFKAESLYNVVLLHGNGEIVVEDALPDNSISRLHIFHPDPWFKKRHHKRRVINPTFLKALKPTLTPGSEINLSTDVEDLFGYMDEQMLLNGFLPIENDSFWVDDYLTHWTKFSKTDSRNIYFGSYTFPKV
jgi:tRNA (guanine-N7-)-methyltransferase